MAENEKKSKKNRAKEYLKNWKPYRLMRYWFYIVITVVALVLPWIEVNGNHFFLLTLTINSYTFSLLDLICKNST